MKRLWNRLVGKKQPTNYKDQVLTDAHKACLDYLDEELAGNSLPVPDGAGLSIMIVQVPLRYQWSSVDVLHKGIKDQLTRVPYIPRSIALVVDPMGTWQFIIGYRGDKPIDDMTSIMFMELLTRTNSARSAV